MFCENCGTKTPDDAKFCGGCGTRTESVQASHESVASQTANPVPPATTYAPPAQAASPAQVYYTPAQTEIEQLSVGQYIGMLLLLWVPILNIILLFMWSFGSSVNPNKKNFARAILILGAISLVIWVVAWTSMWGALSTMLEGLY